MKYYLAIDIGASSGRHIIGHYKNEQLILEETKKEVNLKKIQADEDIAKAKEKALHESYNEVCDLALTASESILKREVKYEDNQKLLDDFINDLEKK